MRLCYFYDSSNYGEQNYWMTILLAFWMVCNELPDFGGFFPLLLLPASVGLPVAYVVNWAFTMVVSFRRYI